MNAIPHIPISAARDARAIFGDIAEERREEDRAQLRSRLRRVSALADRMMVESDAEPNSRVLKHEIGKAIREALS